MPFKTHFRYLERGALPIYSGQEIPIPVFIYCQDTLSINIKYMNLAFVLLNTISKTGGYELSDKQIICAQCGSSFLFSEAEQNRHKIQGFDPPRRCQFCRKSRIKLHDDPPWQRKTRRAHRNSHDDYDTF